MKVGITFLFKNNIEGILKSTSIDVEIDNVLLKANKLGNTLATDFNYDYLGVYDLFSISGEIKEGEILGRTTFYELDTISKAKTLTKKDNFSFDQKTKSQNFNASLIFFCTNKEESFTITVLTIFSSSIKEIFDKIEELAVFDDFKNKIKDISIEEIRTIEFVGIEDICDIDLKSNVFQTFYSDMHDIDSLDEEILKEKQILRMIKDIANHYRNGNIINLNN